ncbi:MAG: energy-coupling factor transporter ATPase [Eubacteriales bacterium]|nr:energy-coupling factor transporter ATPase [Eubacteriales bacterium]
MSIVVKNLTHIYDQGGPFEAKALDGVSFEAHEPAIIGLMGHTGCGKSTLVQHLNALLLPTAGSVVVCGIDTRTDKSRLRELRHRVGMVFQYPEYQLFEETVARDIAFGLRDSGLSEEEKKKRVRAAMEEVALDYDTYAEKSPFDLSGGQKRRAAIAGVLVMEPEILVMDEPAAGLDPRGKEEIDDIIRRYHEKHGATVLIVTHNMDEAAALCSRILVMENGTIAADGSPRQVFSDAERVKAVGLDVPYAARTAAALISRGVPVRPDVLTVEELAAEILRIKEERRA